MMSSIHPKLPMRSKRQTKEYYLEKLNFKCVGEYDDYLIVARDQIEIHFFLFRELDPKENYGQVYIRTQAIDECYGDLLARGVPIHPNGALENKPWQQREFSLLDPDHNLLTFGEAL